MPQLDLQPARALARLLADRFGDKFLGLREDREEITYWVDSSVWADAAGFLKFETDFSVLEDLNAVDYPERNPRFDLAIICLSMKDHSWVRLKTMLAEDQPADTLERVWPGAQWYEREMWDLFGIPFQGNSDLRRLLLPADYQGHPLRKDYPVTGPPQSAYR
ncbi:NADH-quinone oxidoreductase subunit C [bacterium]|nr:NADH-quinone oxidoreductase subunit C [bacterium]